METVLERALEVDGITCVVGAGGKKSTLYELATRLDRAVVTATVRIPIFDPEVARVIVSEDPTTALEDILDGREGGDRPSVEWPLGLVPAQERDDRYVGYDPDVVGSIADVDGVDHVLVKSDGARTRLLKAPNEREPQLPATADTVLAIASCQAVGRPLDASTVHRPELVAELTGRSLGDPIEPNDVATVLTHERGGRKGVPDDATYVPVINMVDDDADLETAHEIGRRIREREAAGAEPIRKVVLTSMIREEPLVAVLE